MVAQYASVLILSGSRSSIWETKKNMDLHLKAKNVAVLKEKSDIVFDLLNLRKYHHKKNYKIKFIKIFLKMIKWTCSKVKISSHEKL
jgi:hypothetical protein